MLVIELYKIKNELASPIMDSMLNKRNITYNFRNLQEFQSEIKRTVFNGLEMFLIFQSAKINTEQFFVTVVF